MSRKPKITKPGTVKKIIKPLIPSDGEKAEIAVEGADDLYREIRIENTLENSDGKKVKLKQGAEVSVTIEADPKQTDPEK
jgi:predicted DNA-binding antitoxin AbrB/MazE fold protein